MQKKTRSILDELDTLLMHKDRENLLESRANNIITGAINLLALIRENYSPEIAADLERRMINSIRGQDPSKFARGIRKLKNEDK